MDLIDQLSARQLVVVTGKGGVGKSVVASALGRCLARRGRTTALMEVDPRENLHQLLDVPPSGGAVIEVDDHLYLQNLKPKAVMDWVVRKQVKMEMVVEKVLASPVYQRFVEGAPGLEQIAILGHALRLTRGEIRDAPKVDTVVLDAPATGHGIYLLTAPRIYAEAIGKGPFADMAREVAELVESASRSALVLATLAEEMPVQEALELRRDLHEKVDREPDFLVVNGLYPSLPEGAATEAVGQGSPDSATIEMAAQVDAGSDWSRMLDLWSHRREVNTRELDRLHREWAGPQLELPLLPIDQGPALVLELERLLERQIAELVDGQGSES